jgi:predicted transcriptional regulator
MLAVATFMDQVLVRRRSRSMASIGLELGVTRHAVHYWLKGTSRPSDAVLLLAERLWKEPIEMSSGLPDPPDNVHPG